MQFDCFKIFVEIEYNFDKMPHFYKSFFQIDQSIIQITYQKMSEICLYVPFDYYQYNTFNKQIQNNQQEYKRISRCPTFVCFNQIFEFLSDLPKLLLSGVIENNDINKINSVATSIKKQILNWLTNKDKCEICIYSSNNQNVKSTVLLYSSILEMTSTKNIDKITGRTIIVDILNIQESLQLWVNKCKNCDGLLYSLAFMRNIKIWPQIQRYKTKISSFVLSQVTMNIEQEERAKNQELDVQYFNILV